MKFLHKYGSLILLLIRIAIIVAVPFVVADAMASHQLINTEYVKYYQGSLYGLDRCGEDGYLFNYDIKKNSGRVIKEKGIKDITITDDGKVYLLKTVNGDSDLLEWNRRGSVKTVIGIAEVEDMKPRRILASNRNVFYIYYTNEAGTETQRFGYNDEWQPVGSTELYYNEGFDLDKAQIADNGDVFFISDNGSIYQAQEMEEPVQLLDVNNGPEDNTAYVNYRFTSHYVSFTNLISGKSYTISTNSGDFTPSEIKRTYQSASTFDDFEMHNAVYTGDNIKAGALYLNQGGKGAAVCGEVEAVTGTVEWSPLQYIVVLLLVAALLVLLYLLVKKPLRKLEKQLLESDVGILIVVTVVLMVGCVIVSNVCLVDYLKVHQRATGKKEALSVADEVVAQLSEMDVNALAESGETPLVDAYAQDGIGLDFFMVKDDEIYYASKTSNPEVPVNKCDPGMPIQVEDAIYSALKTNTVIQCFLNKGEKRYSGVAVPLGDMFGVPSALVITLPMLGFWQEFLVEFIVIAILNLITLVAIFAVILKALYKLQKQLQGLMDASARVLAGELGAQADDSGINEVAAAIKAFNRLSLKLKNEEISVANCEIVTKSFTPLGLMRQINGGFVDTVVKVGSGVQGNAQILGVFIEGGHFTDKVQEREAGYQVIGRFANALSTLGGSIMDVTSFSIRYIDAEMTRDIFRVTAPIIREINMSGKCKVRAVLHVTDIKAVIVGTENYMILDAYETKPRGTRELLEETMDKGVSFLLTDFAAKIAGLNRYHFREVGVFHPVPAGRGETLYEALDACTQRDAMNRWNNRAVFEDGLKAFYTGSMEKARRAMAEVLIEDDEDDVARYYLKKCEGYNDPDVGSGFDRLLQSKGQMKVVRGTKPAQAADKAEPAQAADKTEPAEPTEE